ncbi:uncharacterized protein BYT42DRAFT_507095 [Radiomyces spectabilis]|uniref:uncharacterized protein n=1 Tax=Radiomyces spectabilis TaxID=64574 RepID=UPI002221219A|nr:uncharacterized protein BYT42DRAFT_507095 [Radiomyces spectabilis]KAI8393507.1 hypothetical protein BYT42DRAFT_507095 [Radiomyces spectabilis]
MTSHGKFPEGWFFIKNLSNGCVLMADNASTKSGETIVISSLRNNDHEVQLWRHGEDGRLYNKKTGLVLDVKGDAKAGSEIVQQAPANDHSPCQTFGISAEGHIYLTEKPSLVLGIKESFFSRREGLHVHLQLVDKRTMDRKEQRWDFVVPVMKQSSSSTLGLLKRTLSSASGLGGSDNNSSKPSIHRQSSNDALSTHSGSTSSLLDHDDSYIVPAGSFPDKDFFLKAQSTGYFIGVEAGSLNNPGARLTIDALRKTAYNSQLWSYDAATHRLVNKQSGFALTAEELKEDAYVCQSSANSDPSYKLQAWTMTADGHVALKSDESFVLAFKDSWFGTTREGAHVHLQRAANDALKFQQFRVVFPLIKESSSTSTRTIIERHGVFPDGWFFVKNQQNGLVVTAKDDDHIVLASKLDTSHYHSQLWSHRDGFLINQHTKTVLDVRGGCIIGGAQVCHYHEKKKDNENQQWALTPEGHIYVKSQPTLVLAIPEDESNQSRIYLAHKNMEHKQQQWNFVLPVFKKKIVNVAKPVVTKTITYRYARYPTGWFMVRSFINGSTAEKPLVLTAVESRVRLMSVNFEQWQSQLWTYRNGALINFQTQLAVSVSTIAAQAGLIQAPYQDKAETQQWHLTIDGYLIHAVDSSLAVCSKNDELVLTEHASAEEEHRWGLLMPEITFNGHIQILSRWTVILLEEWRRVREQTVQKVIHRVAEWPQTTFFIAAHDSMMLVPDRSEAFSYLMLRKLDYKRYEDYLWQFKNGFLVHYATGLVLHAADNLVNGSHLQIRGELINENQHADERQMWTIKTDGSIASASMSSLGFGVIQHGNRYAVELCDTNNASEHYSWSLLYGKYENKELIGTETIILSAASLQRESSSRKLVTISYGLFPENWFYIRSKADKSLVLTTATSKKGAKLILSKLDFKVFRRQLWHYRDDGCLANLESDYVIDVAGGALQHGSDIIQWNEKMLKRSRKNQLWSLSVHGHIHPRSRPGLALVPLEVKEAAEVKLLARGALSLEHQQWTFASPVFGKRQYSGVITASQIMDDGIFVNSVGDAALEVSSRESYERLTKRTIIRRWGIFPDQAFFIRCAYGKENLALTVEQKPLSVNGATEYEVVLRALNFKEYKWQFWTFQEGHLINVQTGLALDGQIVKGQLIEDGLRCQLYVREKSAAESQYWALTAEGEIHLTSEQHLVIGVANAERACVEGAQVGLKALKARKVDSNGKQTWLLRSEEWLRWRFSKPVYGTKKVTTVVSGAAAAVAGAAIAGEIAEVIEGLQDEKVVVKENEDSDHEESDEDSDDSDNEQDDVPQTVRADEEKKTMAVVTDNKVTHEEQTQVSQPITPVTPTSPVVSKIKQQKKLKTLQYHRQASFQLRDDYVPTGFEKVVRYKNHQGTFPNGYFFIKSHLHGFVLDVLDDAVENAQIVLKRLRTTDFASQLWSFRDGYLTNLKGQRLVLDGAKSDVVKAGERVHLAVQKSSHCDDQLWEYTIAGLIHLRAKRSLVLSIKELRRSDTYSYIDVFLQEELVRPDHTHARSEQRWEILIPAMIPMSQSETKVKIIEGGRISAISSSASAVLAFKWIKETFEHKITTQDQWPSSDNWFFIRFGTDDVFLAAGENDHTVGLHQLEEGANYRRYMWMYADGFLINYKHMLRIAVDEATQTWILTDAQESAHQLVKISAKGVISIHIHQTVHYLRIEQKETKYQLKLASEEDKGQTVQLHVPVFSDHEVEKSANVASTTAISWLRTQRKTVTTIVMRRGVFPDAPWFFIKIDKDHCQDLQEEYVLAIDANSSSIVVQKMCYAEFRRQLWTFRDGLLINYGSKMVIDVNGSIASNNHIVCATEAGVSSQKWSLTAEGHIQLDSYDKLVIGYSESLKENLALKLVAIDQAEFTGMRWRFAVPVFGKKTTTTETAVTFDSITEAVEQGASIQEVEEIRYTVQDVFQKPSVAEESNHRIHDVLKTVGIAAGATAAAVVAVGAASKAADAYHHTDAHKIHQDESVHTGAEATTTTDDVRKETLTLTHASKASVSVIKESQVLVRAWRIVFMQRIRKCKTQEEFAIAIEQGQQELYQRLDEHVRLHASVHHLVSGATPEWQVSIEQVKELFRARLFDKLSNKVKSSTTSHITFEELQIEESLSTTFTEINQHYEQVLTQETQTVATENETETTTEDHELVLASASSILVTVDSLKVTVRYWLADLYKRLSSKKNVSDEELKQTIEEARQELTEKLNRYQVSVCEHAEKTKVNTVTVKQSVEVAIARTQAIVNEQLKIVETEKHPTEEQWTKVTEVVGVRLSEQLKTCQTAISQELATTGTVQESKVTVVIDQKNTEAAKETVSSKIVESKTRVTAWFSQLVSNIHECVQVSGDNYAQDIVTLVEGAQVEIVALIDEVKFVLRAYHGHLSHLTSAERNRLEYELENVKASLIATIIQYKTCAQQSNVSKEDILRYTQISFGSENEKLVLSELEEMKIKIVGVTVTESKKVEAVIENESSTITSSTQESVVQAKKEEVVVETEKPKVAIETKVQQVVDQGQKGGQVVSEIKHEAVVEKDQVQQVVSETKTSQVIAHNQKEAKETEVVTEVVTGAVDVVCEAGQTVSVEKKQEDVVDTKKQQVIVEEKKHQIVVGDQKDHVVTGGGAIQVVTGDKSQQVIIEDKQHKVTDNVVKKPTQVVSEQKSEGKKIAVAAGASVALGAAAAAVASAAIRHHHQEKDTQGLTEVSTGTSAVIGTQPSTAIHAHDHEEKLVVILEETKVTVQQWFSRLTEKIVARTNQGGENVSQDIDLIVVEALEEFSVTIEKAKQSAKVSAGTSQTTVHESLTSIRTTVWQQVTEFKQTVPSSSQEAEQKLASIKQSLLTHFETAVEECKDVIPVIPRRKSSLTIGKTMSEKTHKVQSQIAVVVEETKVYVQEWFRRLTDRVSQRVQQGGDNVSADVALIISEARQEITVITENSKSKLQSKVDVTSTTNASELLIIQEAQKKMDVTITQVQESVLVKVTEVEQIALESDSATVSEKLSVVCQETTEKIHTSLTMSEKLIEHHLDVVAESSVTEEVEHQQESESGAVVVVPAKQQQVENVTQETIVQATTSETALNVVVTTSHRVSSSVSALIEQIHVRMSHGTANLEEDIAKYIAATEHELQVICEGAEHSLGDFSEKQQFIAVIQSIKASTISRVSQVKHVVVVNVDHKLVNEKLLKISEEASHEIFAHVESIKQTVHVQKHGTTIKIIPTQPQEVAKVEKPQEIHKDDHESHLAKKVLIGSAAVAAGTAIAVEVAKKLKQHKEQEEKKHSVIVVGQQGTTESSATNVIVVTEVDKVKVQFTEWFRRFTSAVTSQESITDEKQLTIVIQQYREEFLKITQASKANVQLKEQHKTLVWVEETVLAQITRIQEMTLQAKTQGVIDVHSRLEVLKIVTEQEVGAALDQCKSASHSWVAVTVEQLKLKENALLDIKSEMALVTQDAKATLTTCIQDLVARVTLRIQQGGSNVYEDVKVIIEQGRQQLVTRAEQVQVTASKRLSAFQTKTTVVVGTAALAGIATAELSHVLKETETTLKYKMEHIDACVKHDQSSTVLEKISAIQHETTVHIHDSIDKCKHNFVSSVSKHHEEGHVVTGHQQVQVIEQQPVAQVSVTVHEVKVTIREWLHSLAEKVSVIVKQDKPNTQQEIDLLITKETELMTQHLELSNTKITESLKSQTEIEAWHATFESVKTTIVQSATEIKTVSAHVCDKSRTDTGLEQITSVIAVNEQRISEVLVHYEQSVTVVETVESHKETEQKHGSQTIVAGKTDTKTETKTDSKVDDSSKKTEGAVVVTVVFVEHVKSTIHSWLYKLMEAVSTCSKKGGSTEDINAIVVRAKKTLTVEFDCVTKCVSQQERNSLEWIRGVALQGALQIQQIGVQSVAAKSKTGGFEAMKPLVDSILTQIDVVIHQCDSKLKITLQKIGSHDVKQSKDEKKTTVKGDKKHDGRDEKKSKCDKSNKKDDDSDSSDDEKKHDKKKHDMKKHDEKKHDEKKSKKEHEKNEKKESHHASGEAAIAIIHHDEQKQAGKITTVTSDSIASLHVVIQQWFEALMSNVSSIVQAGGSKANEEIQVTVEEATVKITEILKVADVKAEGCFTNKSSLQQYRASLQWARNLVIQGSLQVKAIALNATASSSRVNIMPQLRPLVGSIQVQIDTELSKYKLDLIHVDESHAVQQKKAEEKIDDCRKSAEKKKHQCTDIKARVPDLLEEATVVIIGSLTALVDKISVRCKQNEDHLEQDVNVIIVQGRQELNQAIQKAQESVFAKLQTEEHDETVSVIRTRIEESFKTIQVSVNQQVVEIQNTACTHKTNSVVVEKLTGILEKSKTEIHHAVTTVHKESTEILETAHSHAEATVTIVDTVDIVKQKIISWYARLEHEITVILGSDEKDKESKVKLLINEAQVDIGRLIHESKQSVHSGSAVIRKTSGHVSQEDLIATLDWLHTQVNAEVEEIRVIGIQATKDHSVDVKTAITSITHKSQKKIETALNHSTALVVGMAAAAAITLHHDEKSNNWTVDVKENVTVISDWFKIVTQKISGCVKQGGNVAHNVDLTAHQAEEEIAEIISQARIDFRKRLSDQKQLDQAALKYACEHYEHSLEAVRVAITAEIAEVKKTALEVHASGEIVELDEKLTKITQESTERIKIEMGSTVTISEKKTAHGAPQKGSLVEIAIDEKEDAIVVGSEDIAAGHEETTVEITHGKDEKKAQTIVVGSGANTGATHTIVVKNQPHTISQVDITETVTEVKTQVTQCSTTLIEKLSQQIKQTDVSSVKNVKVVVQETRVEIEKLIAAHKSKLETWVTYGVVSATAVSTFKATLEWIASLMLEETNKIEAMAIQSVEGKTDLVQQMQEVVVSTEQQVHTELDRIHVTVKEQYHKDTTVMHEKLETILKSTQDTKTYIVRWVASLNEKVKARIEQGGPSVHEDTLAIIKEEESKVMSVIDKTKTQVSSSISTVQYQEISASLEQVQTVVISHVHSLESTLSQGSVTEKITAIDKLNESTCHTVTEKLTIVEETVCKHKHETYTVIAGQQSTTDKVSQVVVVGQKPTTDKVSQVIVVGQQPTTDKVSQTVVVGHQETKTEAHESDKHQATTIVVGQKPAAKTDVVVGHEAEHIKVEGSHKQQESHKQEEEKSHHGVSMGAIVAGSLAIGGATAVAAGVIAHHKHQKQEEHKEQAHQQQQSTSQQTGSMSAIHVVAGEQAHDQTKVTTEGEKHTVVIHAGESEQKMCKPSEQSHDEVKKQGELHTVVIKTGSPTTVTQPVNVQVGSDKTSEQVAIHLEHQDQQSSEKQGEKHTIIIKPGSSGAIVQEAETKTQIVLTYNSASETIESTKIAVTQWFHELTIKVSACAKAGNKEEVKVVTEEARKQLVNIIVRAKSSGAKHSASFNDYAHYIGKIEWIYSVASTQVTEIEEAGVLAATKKVDITEQIQTVAIATCHQIEVTLEQLKSTLRATVTATKQQVTELDSHKQASAVVIIEETRASAMTWFAELSSRLSERIKQGGANVQQDVVQIIESAEQQIEGILSASKVNDEVIRHQVSGALSIVRDTLRAQIITVKRLVTHAKHSIVENDERDKILSACEVSKHSIQTAFASAVSVINHKTTDVQQGQTHTVIIHVDQDKHQASQAVIAAQLVNQESVTIVTSASQNVQTWYIHLKDKLLQLSERNEWNEERTSAVISQSELELKTMLNEYENKCRSDTHLKIFYEHLRTTVENQLQTVKYEVSHNKTIIKTSLDTIETKLIQEVTTHVDAIKHITVSADKKKDDEHRQDKISTVEKVAIGSAAIASAAAVAVGIHHSHDKEKHEAKSQKVQLVAKNQVHTVKVKIDEWYTRLIEKVTVRTQQGGDNTAHDITVITQEAQVELDSIISECKSNITTVSSQQQVTEERTFTTTLEWIRTTATTQVTEIQTIVKHSDSAIDVKQQIENLTLASKKQVDNALELHIDETVVQVVEDLEVVGSIDVEKQTKVQKTKVTIVEETKEEARERVRKDLQVVTVEIKNRLALRLDVLVKDIRVVIQQGGNDVQEEVTKLVAAAESEIDILIKEFKAQFISSGKTSETTHTRTEIACLVTKAHKQSLDCLDSLKATVMMKLSLIRKLVLRIRVEELITIDEQISAIVVRTKKHIYHVLEHSTETAITTAFDSNVVTWVETTELPVAFSKARVFAFDLPGTIVDYQLSISKALRDRELFQGVDTDAFVAQWYAGYLKQKETSLEAFDDEILQSVLVQLLQSHSKQYCDADLQVLCGLWHELNAFDDAMVGVRRLKQHNMKTVAFSHVLSTSTMVDLAQHACLCWHAQFSSEMFHDHKVDSMIAGTAKLLRVKSDELVIVSANPTVLNAAKNQGAQTVLITRNEETTHHEYGIVLDGIDMLAESFEALLEHQTVHQTESQTNQHRSLFQRIKSTAAEERI